MDKSAIRHIATTREGKLIATAEFEKTISVWDLENGRKISTFESRLDFGGTRLAITPDSSSVIVGSYGALGIGCHDAADGSLIWERKDLRKAQFIRAAESGKHVYCGFERQAAVLLDVKTGETVKTMRGSRRYFESPYEEVALYDRAALEIWTNSGSMIGTLDRESFGILAACFGWECIAISEAGGAARCFKTKDSAETWRYVPPKGSHVLALGFSAAEEAFFAVEWPYEKGGDKSLVRLDSKTGAARRISRLQQPAEQRFCSHDNRLVTSDGWVRETSTGAKVLRLQQDLKAK